MKVTLNKEQTAAEWLYDRFLCAGYAVPAEWKEKAKEMEKEQIINARIDGDENYTLVGNKRKEYAEEYYNQTFNTK
jgi:hypothetical protein